MRPLLPLPLQFTVAAGSMVVMIVTGMWILRRLDYHSRVEGSLGQH